jgi:hypothetical protein
LYIHQRGNEARNKQLLLGLKKILRKGLELQAADNSSQTPPQGPLHDKAFLKGYSPLTERKDCPANWMKMTSAQETTESRANGINGA